MPIRPVPETGLIAFPGMTLIPMDTRTDKTAAYAFVSMHWKTPNGFAVAVPSVCQFVIPGTCNSTRFGRPGMLSPLIAYVPLLSGLMARLGDGPMTRTLAASSRWQPVRCCHSPGP